MKSLMTHSTPSIPFFELDGGSDSLLQGSAVLKKINHLFPQLLHNSYGLTELSQHIAHYVWYLIHFY